VALLRDGETVMSLDQTRPADPDGHDFTLLRRSPIEPGWNQEDKVSMVDFGSFFPLFFSGPRLGRTESMSSPRRLVLASPSVNLSGLRVH